MQNKNISFKSNRRQNIIEQNRRFFDGIRSDDIIIILFELFDKQFTSNGTLPDDLQDDLQVPFMSDENLRINTCSKQDNTMII